MFPRVVDVSRKTGFKVSGEMTSWSTINGRLTVEHLAGISPAGELIVYWWSQQHDWQAVDASKIAGRVAKTAPVSWRTRAGAQVTEKVASTDAGGAVLVFSWSSQHDWQVEDVSVATGVTLASSLCDWQVGNDKKVVEHLAGLTAQGHLIVLYHSQNAGWASVDVTAKTGVALVGSLTAWTTTDADLTVEHVAGVDAHGDAFVFWWSPKHDWQAVNVSKITGRKVAPGLASWQAHNGQLLVEHLAGHDLQGNLHNFWWSPAHDWRTLDITAITGAPIAASRSAYVQPTAVAIYELIAAQGPANNLILHWWSPAKDWQAIDLTAATGEKIFSPPRSWRSQSGINTIEHWAAQGSDNRVLVFWGDAEPRTLTDRLTDPYAGLRPMRNVRRKVVSILWNPEQAIPPTAAAIEQHIFGPAPSVRDFFLENSNGRFTIENAGILGWYPSDHPLNYYFGPPDTNDANGDGFVNEDHYKWAEGIRKAAKDFDFAQFDKDPLDGALDPSELGVLFIMPGTYPFGVNRQTQGADYPQPMPLVVDGVQLGVLAEAYIGGLQNYPLNLGVVAHELSHLLLGAVDEYVDFPQPYRPGEYALMDNSYQPNHHDPFHKLKNGWLRPRLALHGGTYAIRDTALGGDVVVLLDPAHSPLEYFLVENRSGSGRYDTALPDKGLCVWHVIEDPAVYGTVGPPPNVDPAKWLTVAATDWGRRGIALVRIDSTLPLNESISTLQSGRHDLLSTDPNPAHSVLHWADGKPSGFALKSVSAPGATMSVIIETPF